MGSICALEHMQIESGVTSLGVCTRRKAVVPFELAGVDRPAVFLSKHRLMQSEISREGKCGPAFKVQIPSNTELEPVMLCWLKHIDKEETISCGLRAK